MIRKSILLLVTLSVLIPGPMYGRVVPAAAKEQPAKPAAEVENYDSGKERIAKIIANEQTGIPAHNKKHLHYAQTRNLAADLNSDNIAQFFGCKTLIGSKFLAEALKCPVSSQDKDSVLARRQQAIRVLVENPELKKEIEELLDSAREHEQEVVKLMSEFFIGKSCPELQQLEIIKKNAPSWLHSLEEYLCLNPTGRAVGAGMMVAEELGFIGTTGYYAYKAYAVHPSFAIMSAYFGGFSAFLTYVLHKDFSMASEKRVKIHALNRLVTIAEKLDVLCNRHGITHEFSINNISDSAGLAMIQKIKQDRYQHKKMLVFNVPGVHTDLYHVYQQDKHLAELFASIAEMDAYNAIATKIIASATSRQKFCFVEFIEHNKPMMHTKAFWNVLVPNAITNDITEDKHVILTGPNAGGKTTAVKALLQNIVLGQTFGVAAADECKFTMFDIIHSYLNVSDDILNGLSLFASEVRRAQEILQTIKALDGTKKFFFALDELFTGTVAQDGETCAFEFVKKMATFDAIQFIYATHFTKLKELGSNHERCINYKVDAPTKDARGKLVYPFTLSKGASDSRVALDIAREANLFE